ncbi:MAG: tetratricopeptide repeat protein [Saprospiraceae bacterium]|nr:tetratricopeptide repeat protein [Saprospiraceae bacterium]
MRKIFILVFVSLLLGSCVTQKQKDDVPALKKFYHNTTSKYNGYFNANEIMVASFAALDAAHEDNFNKLLPLYPYLEADNPQLVGQELDKAIEKVSIVANLHRQGEWVDDCYLLIGQALFLKQDYEAAEEMLAYMIDEFKPGKKPKATAKPSRPSTAKERLKAQKVAKQARKKRIKEQKKKKKERDRQVKAARKARQKGKPVPKPKSQEDKIAAEESKRLEAERAKREAEEAAAKKEAEEENYFLKKRPAYQEGMLWLAKTMIERDKYDAATRLIGDLEKNPKTFSDLRPQIEVLKAYSSIRRSQFAMAIQPLETALQMELPREEETRYRFVLAQLYQMTGSEAKALEEYSRVARITTNYEMEFSARLNTTLSRWTSGGGTAADAIADLEKMLKDDKNIDFHDRIYFALAVIQLKAGMREAAIASLEQALGSEKVSTAQQAEAYFMLAELFFETDDFVEAKNFYDKALQAMPDSDERYPRVERFSKNLTEIARNLELITLQDSLLVLANLSDEEKQARAFAIKQKQDEERRQALARNASQTASLTQDARTFQRGNPVTSAGTGATPSAFFAYDDRSVKRGERDFERKWGAIALEDNWRRSASRMATAESETIVEEAARPTAALTAEEVNALLAGVPTSETDKVAAQFAIMQAMFTLGQLYREILDRPDMAVEILEALNTRFPGSSFELDSWYNLYVACLDMRDAAKAKVYFDKIVGKYPASNYAQLLQDPNYLTDMQRAERELNAFYDEAYSDLMAGNFQQAFDKSSTAPTRFGAQNILQPRFALVNAMSLGNLKGKEAYVQALRDLIDRYPSTAEERQAREMLRLLGEVSVVLPGGERPAAEKEAFVIEDEQLHYILITYSGKANVNDVRVMVSDYNNKFHRNDNLSDTPLFLGSNPEERIPLIVLRRFKNKNDAMAYYYGVEKNKGEFTKEGTTFELFPVSQNNYRTVLKQKSVAAYREFFREEYLKK